MRSLVKPRVLTQAGWAAAFTCLACYPRLAMWLDRPYTCLFGSAVILWAAFVFWTFVFAWQPEYAHRPVFNLKCPGRIWVMAVLYGICAAIALHFLMDPQLRLTTPKDYPVNSHAWIAMTLFTMSFDTLFLCFAPYAFFMRLLRKPDVSLALTVMFGVFLQYLKLDASLQRPPPLVVVELFVVHVVGGFVSVYLYVNGGVLPVWLMVFILELRNAYDLLTGH